MLSGVTVNYWSTSGRKLTEKKRVAILVSCSLWCVVQETNVRACPKSRRDDNDDDVQHSSSSSSTCGVAPMPRGITKVCVRTGRRKQSRRAETPTYTRERAAPIQKKEIDYVYTWYRREIISAVLPARTKHWSRTSSGTISSPLLVPEAAYKLQCIFNVPTLDQARDARSKIPPNTIIVHKNNCRS